VRQVLLTASRRLRKEIHEAQETWEKEDEKYEELLAKARQRERLSQLRSRRRYSTIPR